MKYSDTPPAAGMVRFIPSESSQWVALIGVALSLIIGASVGASLWPVVGLLIGGLWFLSAPLLTGPLYMGLLVMRSGIDSWAEEAQISVGGFTLNPMGIVNLLLLGAMVLYLFSLLTARRKLVWSRSLVTAMILAVYFSLTVLWSFYPERSLRESIRFAALVAAFALSANLVRHQPRWARQFVTVMMLAIIVPSAVAILQAVTGTGNLDTPGLNRVYGTFRHPNALAMLCMFINLLSFSFAIHVWRERRASALLYLGVFGLTAVVAFLTYTRAVWLALAAGWILSAWYSSPRVSGRLAKTAGLVCLGALASAPVWPIIFGRFAEELATISSMSPDTIGDPRYATPILIRFILWGIALDLFRSQPWFGHGWGMYIPHLQATTRLPPLDPHNDYVRLLAEAGVIGLLLFLALAAMMFRQFTVNVRHSTGLAQRLNIAAVASLAAYLVVAMTDNLFGYAGATLYFWTLAGMALGMVTPDQPSRRRAAREVSTPSL